MSKNFELELAEERAVARIQAIVLRLMDAKNISRTQLAERMGVKLPRISQLLAGDPRNITLRTAAGVLHALDESLQLSCDGIEELDRKAKDRSLLLSACGKAKQWRSANVNDSFSTYDRGLAA